MKKFFLAVPLVFLFSSCALLPFGTRTWIDRKMNNLQLGSSKEEVQAHFGNPIYRVKFPRAAVEVWGYDLGHYWYHDSIPLFFRNERYVGAPRSPYDLMVFMHQMGLADPGAEFLTGHPSQG